MTDDANDQSTESNPNQLTIERTFDAPRERVWQAWTDPDELAEWFGPAGWTIPVCEVDFQEGGVWHYCMRSPDGQEQWVKSTYEEIVEPERIVAVDAMSDEDGNEVGEMPEMRLTVEFEDLGDRTALTLTYEGFPSMEMGEQAMAGYEGAFDDLESHLAA